MILELLPQIFTGIASLAALWFTYNQYTKNKLTDYKIDKLKEQEKVNSIREAGNIATIYGELWELLHFLKADRVYLIQPHPSYKALYISATLEVKRQGISSVKDVLVDVTLESIANFASMLANNEYVFIEDMDCVDLDKKAQAIFMTTGCKSTAIRKMADEKGNWIGNIVVGYNSDFDKVDIQKDLVEKMTRSSAFSIEYILPEFKTE